MIGFDLASRTILLVVGGSRAYGIHTDASDVDVKGVAIPPAAWYHGFLRRFEQADRADEVAVFAPALTDEERRVVAGSKLEGSVYEVRKFLGLATEANPNILDVLFCRDDEIRVATPAGRRLRERRSLFVTARCKHTFSGYAAAQLKRIRGHRAWLLSPPTAAPSRAAFGLPETTLIPADQLAAAQAAVRKRIDQWAFDFTGMAAPEIVHVENQIEQHLAEIRAATGFESNDDLRWLAAARLVGLDANLIYVLQREREFEAASRQWKQYQEWRSSRNKARAELEARYGYDVKHGAHLYRLLVMCREILETGEVAVWRGDRDAATILAIRRGEWPYERLDAWAQEEEAKLDALFNEKRYVVPAQPDREAIDALCVELVEEAL